MDLSKDAVADATDDVQFDSVWEILENIADLFAGGQLISCTSVAGINREQWKILSSQRAFKKAPVKQHVFVALLNYGLSMTLRESVLMLLGGEHHFGANKATASRRFVINTFLLKKALLIHGGLSHTNTTKFLRDLLGSKIEKAASAVDYFFKLYPPLLKYFICVVLESIQYESQAIKKPVHVGFVVNREIFWYVSLGKRGEVVLKKDLPYSKADNMFVLMEEYSAFGDFDDVMAGSQIRERYDGVARAQQYDDSTYALGVGVEMGRALLLALMTTSQQNTDAPAARRSIDKDATEYYAHVLRLSLTAVDAAARSVCTRQAYCSVSPSDVFKYNPGVCNTHTIRWYAPPPREANRFAACHLTEFLTTKPSTGLKEHPSIGDGARALVRDSAVVFPVSESETASNDESDMRDDTPSESECHKGLLPMPSTSFAVRHPQRLLFLAHKCIFTGGGAEAAGIACVHELINKEKGFWAGALVEVIERGTNQHLLLVEWKPFGSAVQEHVDHWEIASPQLLANFTNAKSTDDFLMDNAFYSFVSLHTTENRAYSGYGFSTNHLTKVDRHHIKTLKTKIRTEHVPIRYDPYRHLFHFPVGGMGGTEGDGWRQFGINELTDPDELTDASSDIVAKNLSFNDVCSDGFVLEWNLPDDGRRLDDNWMRKQLEFATGGSSAKNPRPPIEGIAFAHHIRVDGKGYVETEGTRIGAVEVTVVSRSGTSIMYKYDDPHSDEEKTGTCDLHEFSNPVDHGDVPVHECFFRAVLRKLKRVGKQGSLSAVTDEQKVKAYVDVLYDEGEGRFKCSSVAYADTLNKMLSDPKKKVVDMNDELRFLYPSRGHAFEIDVKTTQDVTGPRHGNPWNRARVNPVSDALARCACYYTKQNTRPTRADKDPPKKFVPVECMTFRSDASKNDYLRWMENDAAHSSLILYAFEEQEPADIYIRRQRFTNIKHYYEDAPLAVQNDTITKKVLRTYRVSILKASANLGDLLPTEAAHDGVVYFLAQNIEKDNDENALFRWRIGSDGAKPTLEVSNIKLTRDFQDPNIPDEHELISLYGERVTEEHGEDLAPESLQHHCRALYYTAVVRNEIPGSAFFFWPADEWLIAVDEEVPEYADVTGPGALRNGHAFVEYEHSKYQSLKARWCVMRTPLAHHSR